MIDYLIYLSTANSYISTRDINTILLQAKKYNNAHDITGILLFHNDSFLQVLEGSQKQIYKLYDKIIKDPRHTCYQVPLTGQIEHRIFGSWSMGFSQLEKVKKSSRVKWLSKHILSVANGGNPPIADDMLDFLKSLDTKKE